MTMARSRQGDPGAAWDPVTKAFYMCNTGHLFPIYKSADMASWTRVGSIFTAASLPKWIGTDNWAPEFHNISGTWTIYFAARNVQTNLSVGVAWSPKDAGGVSNILGPYVGKSTELVYTPGMGNSE